MTRFRFRALWPLKSSAAPTSPTTPRPLAPNSGDSAIRLFVSSTFRDLEPERESLRRNVWPILNKACEERGVAFFETDLRWGVTATEVESGQILPICLDLVDRCRPFIVGIIGNRYGGSADRAAEVLSSEVRYRGLLPYAKRGITELELRYAILSRPLNTPAPVALIYGRPGWERAHTPGGEGETYAALIAELARAGIAVRSTPHDLDRFAGLVREDLLAVLEQHLPSSEPSPAEKACREAAQTARLLGYRFVERPAVREASKLVRGRVPRIAIVGPPGSGKTMAAAALARSCSSGAGPSRIASAIQPGGWRDWTEAFTTLITQLGAAELGTDARERLGSAIAAIALRRHVLVIIDGVDDRNLASGTVRAWLPGVVSGATIVVSLRAEAAEIGEMRRQGWHIIELGPFAPPEIEELANRFFAPLGRRMDLAQIEHVAARPRSALEREILLNEIRCVPRFEALDVTVGRLAGLPDLAALVDAAVDRLETEHGGAAAAILRALALAPDGVDASVASMLAGGRSAQLPALRLELLRQALESLVLSGGNRWTLRSAAVRDHLMARLFPNGAEAARAGIVVRLSQVLESPGAAEEVLRQLLILRRWQDIARLLADPVVFDALTRRARQQLRAYWARLHEASTIDRVSVYRAWSAGAPARRRAEAASLAEDLGDPDTAQALAETVIAEVPGDPYGFAVSTLVLARLAEARAEFTAAEALLARLADEPLRRASPEIAAQAAVQRARIALARLGPDAAGEAVSAAAARVALSGNDRLRAITREIEGAIHLGSGNLKLAEAHYKELLAIGERLADLAVLAAAETGLARTALQRGRRRNAAENAARAIRFARIAGDDRILQDALGVSARIAIETNDLDRAGELIHERRGLTKQIGDRIGQLEADVDYARWYTHLGDHAEAARIIANASSSARSVGLDHLAKRLSHLRSDRIQS